MKMSQPSPLNNLRQLCERRIASTWFLRLFPGLGAYPIPCTTFMLRSRSGSMGGGRRLTGMQCLFGQSESRLSWQYGMGITESGTWTSTRDETAWGWWVEFKPRTFVFWQMKKDGFQTKRFPFSDNKRELSAPKRHQTFTKTRRFFFTKTRRFFHHNETIRT